MPRRADPAERRRQVAEALLRVVEADGLDAASLPAVARELGATTGLVQKYFRSKDELLLFAAGHLGDLARTRVHRALTEAGDVGIEEMLLRGMSVVAGAHPDTRDAEGRIWLAFVARAAFHPGLRELHLAGAREIRDRCRNALAEAVRRGEADPDLDVQAAATALAAFADGLALQRALEPEQFTAAVVRGLLRGCLDKIFAANGGPK
ncbi:TetR/AcrR family transcriptional regulator [Rhizohabitans arisaemae]|uniref:TetR/AcrR family transcriptional regulator n=1 Tax=Rhizohabitans arisaemae TaxID=2720610 RepID=UPI0024B21274|nr:TetR/AcrR family transcriptional regulator [Rhizohabitans arisaemae]